MGDLRGLRGARLGERLGRLDPLEATGAADGIGAQRELDGGDMLAMRLLLASLVHGGATPLVVIIGLVLIVVGVLMVFRRSVLMGAVD